MYPFDSQFKQLALKEGFIPGGNEYLIYDKALSRLWSIKEKRHLLFTCMSEFELEFIKSIMKNGCPQSEEYDGYKKGFLQKAIKQGFKLKEQQVTFDYTIHFINQEGDDEDELGSFFYSVFPFFIEGKMLWQAFGIFGNWKTGELHYYQTDDRQIPIYQKYIITVEICVMLNATFREDDCDSVPEAEPEAEAEPPDFATENPLSDWHKATEKDVNHLSLIYLNAGAYGLRQLTLTVLIPIRDITGALINLQRIYSDGSSEFQIDSNIDGGFHRIGNPIDKTIYIADTYTTGARFHERTNNAVAVAFCKENMENVRAVLQEKYPDYDLRLIDDNGEAQEINSSSDPTPEE